MYERYPESCPALDGSCGIEVTEHDLRLARLPDRERGTTLLHITDLHRGSGDADPLIESAIARANALRPDLIVLTGDFVDHEVRDIRPVVEMVAALRARRGVYTVLGNHDQRADPQMLRAELERAGIAVLHNRAVPLSDGLWLAGVDDLYEGRPDLKAALAPIPDETAVILLAHNPNTLRRVPRDLPLAMLSGHTHGGQIVFPFLPASITCRLKLRTPYVSGWYRRGRVWLYVNRGIGVTGWPPLAKRVNCPPEIALFRLDREDDDDRSIRGV